MSAQNVEIVRTLFAYWGTADAGRSYELLAEDVEMDVPATMLSFQGVQRGHTAMRTFWRDWLSAWDEVNLRDAEFRGAGDDVLAFWMQDMRGRGSDVVIERAQAAIFTVRDGKVTRMRYFDDPAQAEAAFGR